MTPTELETVRRIVGEELAKALKSSVAPIAEDVAKLKAKQREAERASRQSVSDLKAEREGVDQGIAMSHERLMRHVVSLEKVVRDSVVPRATGAEAAAVAGAKAAITVENRTESLATNADRITAKASEMQTAAKRQRHATLWTAFAIIVQAVGWALQHFLK